MEVAKYYQEAGYKKLSDKNDGLEKLIEELKAAGRQSEIQQEIKRYKSEYKCDIPKTLAYVDGALFDDYIHDMKIVQRFAEINRQAMIDGIVSGMGVHVEDQFTTIHNYIVTDSRILRKGAVSAKSGEVLLIPINMRDGSIIGIGKGDEDWNCSAPHGAGRLMSRAKAKERFTVAEFEKQMSGIYTTSVNQETLDECPMAYKSMEVITENIEPTVKILKIIKPVYNFKAGGD